MSLSELEKGSVAVITGLEANRDLKHRLHSFGIGKGSKVLVDEFGVAKSTIKIIVNNTMTALRLNEAKKIKVALV